MRLAQVRSPYGAVLRPLTSPLPHPAYPPARSLVPARSLSRRLGLIGRLDGRSAARPRELARPLAPTALPRRWPLALCSPLAPRLAARSSLALLLRLSDYSLSSVIPLQTRCTREAGTNMREQSNRGK